MSPDLASSPPGSAELQVPDVTADPAVSGAFHGWHCACDDCMAYDEYDVDDGTDLDPCNYCPHDNTDHRGDGCLHCGCDVPQ
jgi:hypothetical protein